MLGGTAKEIGNAYLRFKTEKRLGELKNNQPGIVDEAAERTSLTLEQIDGFARNEAIFSAETLAHLLTNLNAVAAETANNSLAVGQN